MFRNSLIALSFAVLAGTTALAAVEKISAVTVTADITAIQNEKAAAYWSNVAADIEDAIVARLVDRIADDGATITVDLREVELASSFERAVGASDAVLVGQVNVSDVNDNSNFNAYELSVSLGTAAVVSADGTTLYYDTLDVPEAYQALVNSFADSVVKRLD
ncbi:hypothetical protein [Tabrizicola sp.]|uniref:hypothetical protein n=1 Tax=Tabrizicola sp. TaxID=2005166 RepID=UPI00286A9CF7|nr:hypothetical protein [Tabrizicola sp.]